VYGCRVAPVLFYLGTGGGTTQTTTGYKFESELVVSTCIENVTSLPGYVGKYVSRSVLSGSQTPDDPKCSRTRKP